MGAEAAGVTGPVAELVAAAATAAGAAAGAMAAATDEQVATALGAIADALTAEAGGILAANREDVAAGQGVLSAGSLDRLRLGEARLAGIAGQVQALAALPSLERVAGRWTLANGLEVEERRVPVGVIGANYEARPNVTVDFATQLIKSRNAGVLRTGGASLRSAAALADRVIGPGLTAAGLPGEAIQLVRSADRAAADALVSFPRLMPLVILRGSGEMTASLARAAAARGVRTLSHAEGGGVLYVHPAADPAMALGLIEGSLDRLGVCNRLNLLLVDSALWEGFVPAVTGLLARLGITASLPPHGHPIGYEWATDPARDATVTIAPAAGPAEAARIASTETSGLAAGIVTADPAAARAFLDAYQGTAGFWNATTRWLDGFELTAAPETGINIDRVPGPRGPVTYRDLYLRQYVITGDGSQRR
jgi:glutamate-5-semialdehyde dehydrogenase